LAIRTFLDANVLIAAHRGEPVTRDPAQAILADSSRVFIASPFLSLETLPKATYSHNTAELPFLKNYFENVRMIWIGDLESIVRIAHEESERCRGLGAMDALHIAAAYLGEAQVLFTLEGKQKPIHQSSLVRVVFLLD
jgi:predicted nucleic acid-binding protein